MPTATRQDLACTYDTCKANRLKIGFSASQEIRGLFVCGECFRPSIRFIIDCDHCLNYFAHPAPSKLTFGALCQSCCAAFGVDFYAQDV